MKTVLNLISAVIIFSSFNGFAQIKVYDDNRVKIFGDRPTDDINKDLAMQLYGKYGIYLANGRIGFGSYGIDELTFSRKRVFVGELGTNFDSDKLELCGSQGLYLTWGQGYNYNNIVGNSTISMEIINGVINYVPRFFFNTYVYSKGVKLSSDERFKENIAPLNNTLEQLNLLKGVSYNLKTEFGNSFSLPESGSQLTDKEISEFVLFAQTMEKLNNSKKQNFGFIAQELKEVFPDLVEKDSIGYLQVDYLGLIPVLVESIKEQQAKISALKSVLSLN